MKFAFGEHAAVDHGDTKTDSEIVMEVEVGDRDENCVWKKGQRLVKDPSVFEMSRR